MFFSELAHTGNTVFRVLRRSSGRELANVGGEPIIQRLLVGKVCKSAGLLRLSHSRARGKADRAGNEYTGIYSVTWAQ